jgi:uncharacterized protein YhfF/DNA-binding CsgD family transcriptional regulator
MRSARSEAFWEEFRRHEGLNTAHYEETKFRTPAGVADRLLDQMLVGAKRVASGALHFFGEGGEEPLPQVGDYAVLVDRQKRPRLIWHTTGITVAPLSSVTDNFVWRDCTGNGDRVEWLRRVGASMAGQAREYGFEMHADIETVFETLEVVWPYDVAQRIRSVVPHLDRGIALLERLKEQQSKANGLEAILARIATAVLTVGPTMVLGFSNPAAEVLLRRGDGLLVRNGCLTARRQADQRRMVAAVSASCRSPTIVASLSPPIGQPGTGSLVSICRDEDQPPYRVSIFPLWRDHTLRGLTSKAEAALFVDDPNDGTTPAPKDLYSRAFQLTPAEARLAVYLSSGASLTEAADEFGVTHNTVRAQLRSIFDKTNTHRQGDLVRLLHTTSSLRIALS